MEASTTRPLRADAERNRRRLLDAAASCFAEQGLDVSVSEIAKRAGVGQGTAFRRFPTKDHLVAAIVVDRMQGFVARARELAGEPAERDPWLRFMAEVVEQQVTDRALAETVGMGVLNDPEVHDAHMELLSAIEVLVKQAQEAGRMRDDVSAVDVIALSKGVAASSAPLIGVSPRIWKRYLDLVRDALRPGSTEPLTGRPPTRAQLERGLADHSGC